MGEASLAAGDVDGGVDESTLEPEGAASSESPLGSRGTLSSPIALPQQNRGLGRACGTWGPLTGRSCQASWAVRDYPPQ